MRWPLGRVAATLVVGALLAVMCAGYAGSRALLGAATVVGAVGFVLLVINVLRR